MMDNARVLPTCPQPQQQQQTASLAAASLAHDITRSKRPHFQLEINPAMDVASTIDLLLIHRKEIPSVPMI
jgi:hypothetical protein